MAAAMSLGLDDISDTGIVGITVDTDEDGGQRSPVRTELGMGEVAMVGAFAGKLKARRLARLREIAGEAAAPDAPPEQSKPFMAEPTAPLAPAAEAEAKLAPVKVTRGAGAPVSTPAATVGRPDADQQHARPRQPSDSAAGFWGEGRSGRLAKLMAADDTAATPATPAADVRAASRGEAEVKAVAEASRLRRELVAAEHANAELRRGIGDMERAAPGPQTGVQTVVALDALRVQLGELAARWPGPL
jgi:hypothetical protein